MWPDRRWQGVGRPGSGQLARWAVGGLPEWLVVADGTSLESDQGTLSTEPGQDPRLKSTPTSGTIDC